MDRGPAQTIAAEGWSEPQRGGGVDDSIKAWQVRAIDG